MAKKAIPITTAYQIWSEGIKNQSIPLFHGVSEGTDFEDAVRNFQFPEPSELKFHKGRPPMYKRSRLFDNEEDATP